MASPVACLVQTRVEQVREDRWYRIVTKLQRELAIQSKNRRCCHIHQLRARLFKVVDTSSWTAQEDQLYAVPGANERLGTDAPWTSMRAGLGHGSNSLPSSCLLEVPVRLGAPLVIPVDDHSQRTDGGLRCGTD